MKLRITAGPGAPGEVEISSRRFVIGRDPESDLRLQDGEVSREHASLSELPDGRLRIEDLGSRNGTFVDGRRIKEAVVLSGGEQLRVGATILEPRGPRARRTPAKSPPPEIEGAPRQLGAPGPLVLPAALIAGFSIALLASMLLAWFSAKQVTTASGTVEFTGEVKALLAQSNGPTDFGASAWQAFAGFDIAFALVAALGVGTAIAMLTGRSPIAIEILAGLFGIASVLVVVLIAIKLISPPDLIGFLAHQTADQSADLGATAPGSVAVGGALGLLAAIGCAVSATFALRAARPRP